MGQVRFFRGKNQPRKTPTKYSDFCLQKYFEGRKSRSGLSRKGCVMKRLLPIFSCLLLFCSTAVAQLNGSDNFNDSEINTNLWDEPLIIPGLVEETFVETNGHLHFSSTNVDGRSVLPWKASAPFDKGWEVQIEITLPDLVNTSEQQYDMALELTPYSVDQILSNRFTFGMSKNEANEKKFFGNFVTNSIEAHDLNAERISDTATLRMRWDSFASNLYADVSTDSGVTWTNYWEPVTNPFSMSSSDHFSVQIYGASTGREISISDNLYCDNFEATLKISKHISFISIDLNRDYNTPFESGDDEYSFNFEATTDEIITNVTLITPAEETIPFSDHYLEEGEHVWQYEIDSLSPLNSRFEDGDYIVTVTYTNGLTESTIIPFAQADGITPLTNITSQPLFTAPDPLHDTLFSPSNSGTSSTHITLEWGDIDPHANAVNIWMDSASSSKELGIFSDIIPFATGPLSTRSVGPATFTQGGWEVELFFGNATYQTNTDGVVYAVLKGAESVYILTVLEASEDEDGDGIPNWWESLYFSGPTNAIASGNPDEDSCDNREEYISGMNPTNATSCFMITNCVPQAGPPAGFLIEWPSVSGRVYRAYWAPTLTNSFHPLETNMFYPRNSCTDTVHGTDGKCFYRIDVQLQ